MSLHRDLNLGHYRHGGYRAFEVTDNKRRLIRVAGIRDRVVHRLIYEELKFIFDGLFIYDVWSCRAGKGLIGAVNRAQELRKNKNGWVWRCDIRKFFDSIDKVVLLEAITRKVNDANVLVIIKEIIFSNYNNNERERERVKNAAWEFPLVI